MMIDFAIETERKEGESSGVGHLSGLLGALVPDHDDDHGALVG